MPLIDSIHRCVDISCHEGVRCADVPYTIPLRFLEWRVAAVGDFHLVPLQVQVDLADHHVVIVTPFRHLPIGVNPHLKKTVVKS